MASLWELQIRRSSATRYDFTLTADAGALAFVDHVEVPAAIHRDLVGRARPPRRPTDVDAWLANVGDGVLRILPRSIRSELARLSDVSLVIATDDTEIPWEFARIDGEPLLQRVVVARRMLTRSLPEQSVERDDARERMEVLLVTNPTGDLDAAQREGDRIAAILSPEPLIQVTRLTYPGTSSTDVSRALEQRRYDAFHYAGHVRREAGRDVFVLQDGPVDAEFLAQLFDGRPPEIAFANGCQSARSQDEAADESSPAIPTGSLASSAYSFLAVGARAYIGTYWDVEDEAAATFGITFYQRLIAGDSIGGALAAGRASVTDKGAGAWAAHVLYGRPTDKVQAVQPVIERRRKLDRLRRMLTSPSEARRRRAAIQLGEVADAEATEPLLAALSDEIDPVSWRAVIGLATIGTPEAIRPLLERLATAESEFALHILILLRFRGDNPELAPAVRRTVQGTGDRLIRIHGLITLASTRDRDNVAFFERYLDDDDRLMQVLAVEGLGRAGPAALASLDRYQPDVPVLEAARQRAMRAAEGEAP